MIEPENEPETIDGELVLAEVPEATPVPGSGGTLDRPLLRSLPAPVVAATAGFLAGVVTFVLVRVLRRPAPKRSKLGLGTRKGKGDDVVASRSFLVDVHLLKR